MFKPIIFVMACMLIGTVLAVVLSCADPQEGKSWTEAQEIDSAGLTSMTGVKSIKVGNWSWGNAVYLVKFRGKEFLVFASGPHVEPLTEVEIRTTEEDPW